MLNFLEALFALSVEAFAALVLCGLVLLSAVMLWSAVKWVAR